MLLIDTSLWIEYLRGSESLATQRLRDTLESNTRVYIAPVIFQEILQGAQTLMQLERWDTYFSGLRICVSDDPMRTRQEAARLYLRCRQAGITPRASNDCLIARTAIEHQLILVHRDRDFSLMAEAIAELRQEAWLD